jgi:cardiolipin synthase
MADAPGDRAPGTAAPNAGPERGWLTLPNLLSLLRLAGVPLFLWLLLGPQADALAVVVLAAAGVTDWLDGKLARWLNQYSRLGRLLDPTVDRLYILAAVIAFLVRDIVPVWLVALLVGRDLVLALCLWVLRRRGYGPFVVTYLGKAATFSLLYAFPLLLVGQGTSWFALLCRPFGYAFLVWGTALYLWSGLIYFTQFLAAMRRPSPSRKGGER